MSEAFVTCPDGMDHDSARIVSGIVRLFSEYLDERGGSGEWELELFKKTGAVAQERVVFKRKIDAYGNMAALFQIRPMDRNSSWKVIAYPPSDADLERIMSAKRKRKAKPVTEPVPVKQTDSSLSSSDVIFDGKVCLAKVASHRKHGLNVEIEEKGFQIAGFIALADLGGYDPKILNKFPVGKAMRVLICDSSRSPITCSTKVNVVLTSDDSKDTFTGATNKRGLLMLKSFVRDYKRVYDLVESVLIPLTMEVKENFISHDRAVDEVKEYLLKKYGAKAIDYRSVPAIIGQICGRLDTMPIPLVERHPNGNGYRLTEFGWAEFGGQDRFLSDNYVEPEVEQQVEEPEEQQPETVETEWEKPETKDNPLGAASEAEGQFPSQAEMANHVEDWAHNLDLATTYFGKACRLAEISSQISSLQGEKEEIEKWLEDHKGLRKMLREFQSIHPESKE